MKKSIVIVVALFYLIMKLSSSTKVDAAAVLCSEPSKQETSEVNKFFSKVQCTLEKAKPLVEEIEKEAKKLEASAKKFGESVINKFARLMERLLTIENYSKNVTTIATTTTASFAPPLTTTTKTDDAEILDESSSSTTRSVVVTDADEKEIEDNAIQTNEIDDDSSEKCPNNQVLDIDRKCQPVIV